MKLQRTQLVVASALLMAAGTQIAGAVATLRISDGANTALIVDGGGLDLSAATGAVGFIGSFGNWNLTISLGVTKPVIGTSTSPQMDMVFLASSAIMPPPPKSSTNPLICNLVIEFSEDNFGPMAPGYNYAVSIGGTTADTVSAETLVGLNNTLFSGTSLGLKTFNHTTPHGSYALDYGAPGTQTSPFSLTKRVSITHNHRDANGNYIGPMTSDGDAHLTVPDGGTTIAMLGISLLGLGALRKQLRK